MKVLAFDIETNGLLDTVSEMWCICIANVMCPTDVVTYTDRVPPCEEKMIAPLQEGLDRLLSADRLVAHNGIGYDVPAVKILQNVDLPLNKVWDTQVVGGLLEPERRSLALKTYGEAMGYPKGDYDDWTGGYTEDMRVYCVRDVEITARLYADQMDSLEQWRERGYDMTDALRTEHVMRDILFRQEQHGFNFDVEAAEALDADLRGELSDLEVELQNQFEPAYRPDKGEWDFKARTWINTTTFYPKTDNRRMGYVAGAPLTKVKREMFNPGSRAQIAQRLSQAFAWKPTQFTPAGTPIVDESMLQDLDYQPAKVMRQFLKTSKQVGQLSEGKNGWLRLHRDGRIHGQVRSCGARTHRMSHMRPNTAQVDKDTRMRSLWTANEGDRLVGADASGLELRLMAAYLYSVDGGTYADSVLYGNSADGTDVHTLNQKAVGLHSRNSAKTIFYAWLYGAGDAKLGSVVIEDALAAGMPKPKGNVYGIGKKARADLQRGIDGIDRLIAYAQKRAKEVGYLMLPDGRPVKSTERTALNSLLQGAGAVLMKKAAVIYDTVLVPERGLTGQFGYCANVHDEIQFSVRPDYEEQVGQAFCDAIEMAGVELGYKIPFAGEYDVGDNWAETH